MDIDTDFQDDLRPKVLDYVRFKYGRTKVANIITFGTAAAKNSAKIINRVLDGSVEMGNKISDLITESTLEKSLQTADLAKLYETNSNVKKIIDLAKRIEGLKCNQSIHACASIICDNNITEYMPEILMDNKKTGMKEWTTQMEGPTCEELGCLKMDFLGLRTLGYVHEAIDFIKENKNVDIIYDEIPLNDMNVYAHLAKGNTASIFQVESEMFTATIKKILQDYAIAEGNECFDRLVAMNALVRPGSNIFIDDFADRIMNPDHVTYLVPELEPILKETYGIILFQEQTMRITRDLAGFSMGQADTVRKAMGKKKKEIMDEYKDYFVHGSVEKNIKGCVANGIDEAKASELWDIMALAASYSFNKSHAVAYSMHSIRTAWLSYYYPFEYLTAVLNSFSDDVDKLSQYLSVARNANMELKPPLLNESKINFSTNGKYILAGLSGIKSVGKCSEDIIKERNENGNFTSLKELLERMSKYPSFSKRTMESLIYAGALDIFEGTRKAKILNLENLAEYPRKIREHIKKMETYKTKLEEYPTLLQKYEETPKIPGVRKIKPRMPKEPVAPTFKWVDEPEELDKLEMLLKEKKYTGMFLSGNPLSLFSDITDVNTPISKVKDGNNTITGVIIDCEKKTSKKGNSFWTFNVENEGILKCVAFKYDGEIETDMVVQLSGKVETDEFGTTLLVNEIKDLSKVRNLLKDLRDICLSVDDIELGKKLRKIKLNKGSRNIYVSFQGKNKKLFAENVEVDIKTAGEIIEILGLNHIDFC